MLMLRPSAIIAWMAGTPSAVAGIFTNRLGAVDPLVQRAGGRQRGLGVVGQLGATSTETNPSVPPLASNTGRRTASAAVMSSTTSCQYASSTGQPAAVSAANCSS